MNLYFLVEGQTERKLYPKWLEHLLPSFGRIYDPHDANENNYVLISGGGYPRLLDIHLENSVEDITDSGNYDFFILVLDSDEVTPDERIEEIHNKISHENINLGNCELQIVVQNRCIETWLLGSRRILSRNPTSQELLECIRFYNVFENDPERMNSPERFDESVAAFHYEYLRLMLAVRNIR